MGRPYTRYPCGIYGPRNLIRRRARKVKRRLLAEAAGEDFPSEPPIPSPGQEWLFSFWAPALEAGVYTTSVTQVIASAHTSEEITVPLAPQPPATQEFEVVAPRFTLPDDAIHSSFPPQGYGAPAKTLPHVVLTDPHLPWDRIASALPDENSPDWLRNQVPWLALLVFTAPELTLSKDQLGTGPASLFSDTSLSSSPVLQSQTFTINMPIADIPKIKSTLSPISKLPPEPSDDKATDIVFLPSWLYTELFTMYDADGKPKTDQKGPDVSRYKYLAHVRDINTTGMADAGVEDNGVFGIIVSHRTGPLSNTQAQPVVVHLVSIEGIESDFIDGNWPIDRDKYPYVALSSLHSWNFVTLPEGSFDIVTTLRNLGTGVNVLRAPDAVIKSIDISTPMGQRLQSRLKDGYTLTRYRTATGETTSAIYRGPFTPTLVPYPLMPDNQGQPGSTWLSNSGIDLQIMDPEIGIIDVTYAVAWQLGKTLAVSDKTFAVNLVKLRTMLYGQSMPAAKAEVLRRHGAYKTLEETASGLKYLLPKLNELHKNTKGLHGSGGSMADRWNRPQAKHLDLSYTSPLIQEIFRKHCDAIGQKFMLSSDGDRTQRYDEQNMPSSTEWAAVLNWVLNKMCLYGVPAHYLVVDPTYLGDETLRFFHVDRNWTDALIDGALSLGNHIEGTDQVRQTIHKMISDYLYPDPPVSPPPQYPLYGFLMHSEAVTKFPDLKVTVNLQNVSDDKAPILRHENLDATKGVMLCLLDHVPGDPGLLNLTFTEPPHQQSFIAGAELDSKHILTLYKKIFTKENQPPDPTPWDQHPWTRPTDDDGPPHSTVVFRWGDQPDPEVRTLLPELWAQDLTGVLNYYGKLEDPSSPLYGDTVSNSAVAGIQLNDPIYQLVIGTIPGNARGDGSINVPFPAAGKEKANPHRLTTAHGNKSKEGEKQTAPAGKGEPGVSPTHRQLPYREKPTPKPDDKDNLRERPSRRGGESPKRTGPSYTINCIPTDNDPSNPGVPCGTQIPKDLVFTIVQQPPYQPAGSGWHLKELMLTLQLSAGIPSRVPLCLLDTYTGPGPFMTSNLRYNVVAQPTDQDGPAMALRVIPRSPNGWTVAPMSREMTFILPVCLVNDHDIRQRIPVWVTSTYVKYSATVIMFDVIKFPQH
ncbi:hypothetical protein GE09DRAFT_947165 [Coniochaeta sp. 2T2.1]|nr:hypothetical protein GE09DRAFT_947165 [Coniochaeta sp. 2T2.1]